MPAPDSEPERYSIDQMMERLKSRSPQEKDGEAELVTREDGTQVYRVRKRKRRSHQPKKDIENRERRTRVIQVVAAVSLVALIGISFVASLVYLNSSGYRESIIGRIRTWTGAEVKVSEFRVTPVSAGAGGLELTWPESSALRHLRVQGLQGDLRVGSLFSGVWTGSEISSAYGGTLVVGMPSGEGFSLPSRTGDCPFQFRYRVPKFNVLFGGAESPLARVMGTEASLVVLNKEATKGNLQLEGGQVSLRNWGSFGLAAASLQMEDGGVRLGNIRLTSPEVKDSEIFISNPSSSKLDLSGKENIYELRVSSMPLTLLTGPGFGAWLTGHASDPQDGAPGSLSFTPGEEDAFSLKLPFRALPAAELPVASGLPMFEVLANGMRNPWYVKPRFNLEARGVLTRDASVVRLEDLLLDAQGYLVISGSLAVHADGRMEGMLDVGLPESAVEAAGFDYRKAFHRRERGMAWALVTVSGTRTKPQDNLTELLKSTSARHAPVQNSDLEDEFLDLTR